MNAVVLKLREMNTPKEVLFHRHFSVSTITYELYIHARITCLTAVLTLVSTKTYSHPKSNPISLL